MPPPTDADFRRLIHRTDRELRGLARDLAERRISVPEWGGRMLGTLAEAHARAGFHGRQRAGDRAPFDTDDTRFGNLAAQEEQHFLHSFEQDLLAGRYRTEAGDLDVEAVTRRGEAYLRGLYATANEAMAWTDGGRIWWRLGPTDQNCVDCVELAEHSPYTPARLPTVPGAAKTICNVGCACFLETESGLTGFRL